MRYYSYDVSDDEINSPATALVQLDRSRDIGFDSRLHNVDAFRTRHTYSNLPLLDLNGIL